MTFPEKAYKCFMEARCCQLFYASCIDESCTEEEREFFQDLALESTNQVITINKFATKYYGINFIPWSSTAKNCE